MVEARFRAMGCEVAVLRDGGPPEALAELPAWFEARENALSRFRSRSALCQLNAQPGMACAVDSILWHALDTALRAAEWSDGLVTPTVGAAVVHAGYDRDFEALRQQPPALRRGPAVPAPDWRGVERDFSARTVRLPQGVQLDLGGTVKGAAADALARRLGEAAGVLVDVGGDLAVRGARKSGEPWPVAVANPLRPGEPLAVLALSKGGVATSGRDFRRWATGHHLIDPRTGAPSTSLVLSATVVADAALTAEVAAKVVLLLGADPGFAWLERHGLGGLVVLEGGAVRTNPRFEDHVWR